MPRYILALLAFLAVVGAASVAGAVDIKCHCSCRDAVGTYKRSCYSTDSCDVCCAYSSQGGVSTQLQGAARREEVESTNGRFSPIAPSGAGARR